MPPIALAAEPNAALAGENPYDTSKVGIQNMN